MTRHTNKPRQRDKVYSPDPRQRFTEAPMPDAPADAGRTWSSTPGHLAHYKPTCTDCRELAMAWLKCPCGAVFALCHNHNVQPRSPRGDRDAHQQTCAAAKANR